MSQDNSISQAIIDIMKNYPTLGLIVLCIMFFVFFILIGVYLFAFYQGREVQIFGMRIGPKPELPGNTAVQDHNEADRKIIETINILFDRYEKDIDWFFEKVGQLAERDSLLSFVRECRNVFSSGKVGETRMYYPWDFTISIMDIEGRCIDHDYIPVLNGRVAFDPPWNRVIKEKTGSFYWVNSFKSASMKKLFSDEQYGIKRVTKLYFKQFDKTKTIVTFELHLNIIYQLPKNINSNCNPQSM